MGMNPARGPIAPARLDEIASWGEGGNTVTSVSSPEPSAEDVSAPVQPASPVITIAEPRVSTVCLYPRSACFQAAEQILGAGRTWHPDSPINARQLRLVQALPRQISDLARFRDGELDAMADFDYDAVMSFLAKRGSPVTLQPFGVDEFGTASALEVNLSWVYKGKQNIIEIGDRTYQSAVLSGGVEYKRVNGHPNPIATIAEENGDQVCITLATERDFTASEDELIAKGDLIATAGDQLFYDKLEFAAITHSQSEDNSWMQGMWTYHQDGRRCTLVEAKQHTRFKMDHRGAQLKSEAAQRQALEAIMRDNRLVINGPSLVTLKRPGVSESLLVGIFGPKSWIVL